MISPFCPTPSMTSFSERSGDALSPWVQSISRECAGAFRQPPREMQWMPTSAPAQPCAHEGFSTSSGEWRPPVKSHCSTRTYTDQMCSRGRASKFLISLMVSGETAPIRSKSTSPQPVSPWSTTPATFPLYAEGTIAHTLVRDSPALGHSGMVRWRNLRFPARRPQGIQGVRQRPHRVLPPLPDY